jgi:hypothetical protein
VAHACNSSVKIAHHRERCTESYLGLGIAWIYLHSLPQDFDPSLRVPKIGERTAGIAQDFGTTSIGRNRQFGRG